jgi:hypothetical protein
MEEKDQLNVFLNLSCTFADGINCLQSEKTFQNIKNVETSVLFAELFGLLIAANSIQASECSDSGNYLSSAGLRFLHLQDRIVAVGAEIDSRIPKKKIA